MTGRISMSARRKLVAAVAERYRTAERDEKGRILDKLTAVTGYASGPSRSWVKTKCPQWRRANADRHKLLKSRPMLGPSEREKALEQKRAELARVRASL
jgi:hypothetical protein